MKLRFGIFTVILLFSLNVDAASDAYLKIKDLPGESTKIGHEGEIEILSWVWSLSRPVASATAGGGQGTVEFKEILITKYADISSPLLMLSTANGKRYPDAVLTLERPGERPFTYYKLTFGDLLVTSYSVSGSSGDDRPTETFSLNFTKVKVEYIPQRADGSAGTPVEFTWDLATNTP